MRYFRLKRSSNVSDAKPGEVKLYADDDGTLHTIDQEGTVVDAGGGAAATQTYGGATATVVSDTPTALAWSSGTGTAGLLDISAPTAPTFVDEGVYAVTVVVAQVTNAATPAGLRVSLSATANVTGSTAAATSSRASTILDDTDNLTAYVTVQLTVSVPAGSQLQVQVLHEDSGTVDLAIEFAYLAKIS